MPSLPGTGIVVLQTNATHLVQGQQDYSNIPPKSSSTRLWESQGYVMKFKFTLYHWWVWIDVVWCLSSIKFWSYYCTYHICSPYTEKLQIKEVISPLKPNIPMAIPNHVSSFKTNKNWANLNNPTKQKKGYLYAVVVDTHNHPSLPLKPSTPKWIRYLNEKSIAHFISHWTWWNQVTMIKVAPETMLVYSGCIELVRGLSTHKNR